MLRKYFLLLMFKSAFWKGSAKDHIEISGVSLFYYQETVIQNILCEKGQWFVKHIFLIHY